VIPDPGQPRRHQHGADLVAVQSGGMGLVVQAGPTHMRRRGDRDETLLFGVAVEAGHAAGPADDRDPGPARRAALGARAPDSITSCVPTRSFSCAMVTESLAEDGVKAAPELPGTICNAMGASTPEATARDERRRYVDDAGQLRDPAGNVVDPASESWWDRPWVGEAAKLLGPEWMAGQDPDDD
jgi:hypothetical protein